MRSFPLCVVITFFANNAMAADTKPMLGIPGRLVFEDDFSRGEMKPKWHVGKGKWVLRDGVASAEELPADNHSAAVTMEPRVPYRDVIIEFSFQFDQTKTLHVEMRDRSYKESHAGHINCASILPGMVRLADYKNGIMKNAHYEYLANPKLTRDEKTAYKEKLKEFTPTFPISLDLKTWHQARVEVVGDEMLMRIDGNPVGYLRSPGIAHTSRNIIGFALGGKATHLKSVKAWEATPAPDWPANRTAIIQSLKKN